MMIMMTALQVHHQWYYSIGISAEYAHPIEFILGNALPSSAGASHRDAAAARCAHRRAGGQLRS